MFKALRIALLGVLLGTASASAQIFGPVNCPVATTSIPGCVKPDGTTVTITNGIISAPSAGSGNVTGPASSTTNDLASYSSTTGKVIADSGIQTSNVQLISGLASPAAIGNTTPNSGAFTTLSATGAVSGAGITALFASPPAIGGTAPAAGAFTTLSATGAVSGAGITALFASPPALGGTVSAAVFATNLFASGSVTGAGFTSLFASPPPLGGTTPAAVSATNLSASGTVSGAGFTNFLASPPAIGGTTPAAITGTSFEARTGAYLTDIANAGTTGTTQFLLAKLTGAGTAVVAGTSDTGGVVIGAVQSATGTTGNAQIAVGGQATCTFDGATTQDDFVQVSTTSGGDCHDTGSTSFPTSGGQVLGRVLSTHAAGGNYLIAAFPPAIVPSSGGGSTTFSVTSKTGSYTLNATTDVGTHFDNNGAAGTVPFTLPTGSNGLNYCFMNLVSGQTITITAPSGIKISIGEVQSGGAGILTLPTLGDGQCVEFLQSQWFGYAGAGSWTLQ